MTDLPPERPSDDSDLPRYAPPPAADSASDSAPRPPAAYLGVSRPSFSKQAIAGFAVSCIALFVFGFLGILGFVLSMRGLRATRDIGLRGRGLAIAGVIIGLIDFLYWAFSVFVLRQ